MRVPKWIWLLLAVVVAVCGAVAYVAVNLSSYLTAHRDSIAERVTSTLGRPVRFDRLELSIGRGVGIAIHDLAIGEDPRFGSGDFLTARSAFVQIRLLPALFGHYEVARVSLESPAISVVRTGDGISFETLSVGHGNGDGDDASPAERRAIAIALLDIEDATVRYVDRTRKPAQEIGVTQLEFEASDLSFGDAVRFELSAAVLGAASPNVSVSGAIGPVDPADVPATPLDVIFQLAEVDGRALQAALPATLDLQMDGPITAKLEAGGTVSAWTLNFALNPGRSRLAYGGVIDKPRDVDLSLTGHLARRADDTIVADGIEIATASSKLRVDGTFTPGERSNAYALTLNGAGVSLADLASLSPAARSAGVEGHADIAIKGIRTAVATVPSLDGRIGLDGAGARWSEGTAGISHLSGIVSLQGTSATLAPSDLRVGGFPARLSARIDDIFAPTIAFDLSAPSLPLAALMADAGDDALRELTTSGRLALTKRAPELSADVWAASATIRGLAITNVRATLVHADGSTRADPIAFDTCGGSLRGSLRRTVARPTSPSPRIELNVNAARIDLADLATSLAATGGGAPASGALSFDLAAAGTGTDWPSLQQALEGSGRFDISNGAIVGTNIPEATLERITGVPGLSALLPPRLRTEFPGLFGQKDTRFDSLAAAFHIANGRVETRDLTVRSRDFAIDAGGTIGLDLGVDLAATLTPSVLLSSRLIEEVGAIRLLANREGSVTIPFRLIGTLPGVKPQPDMAAVAARLQRGLVGALGEKLLGGQPKTKPTPAPAP
jgi:uncharacterized protein involved in outer membrane biogenesis